MMAFRVAILVLLALCQLGLPLEYTPSRQYNYHYETQVAFNEPGIDKTSQPKKDVGFKFTSDVSLTPVWNTNNKMLVKLTLTNTKLHSVAADENAKKDAKSVARYPLYFHWEGSTVRQVFFAAQDSAWSSNMKVAIASLLQIQRDNGHREEIDISGRCDVNYKVEGNTVLKTKTDCSPVHSHPEFSNVHTILDLNSSRTTELRYEIDDDIIQSVEGRETYVSRVAMLPALAGEVILSQTLTLSKVVSGSSKVQASSLQEAVQVISAREKLDLSGTDPVARIPRAGCGKGNCDLAALVAKHRGDLEASSASTPEAAASFLDLVAAFRLAEKDAITAVLKDADNDGILLSLIDVLSATQTEASQAALMSFLDFTETYDISVAERYLLGTAFATHPTTRLVKDLFELYQQDVADERLRDSVGDALGAVLYTFGRQDGAQKNLIVSTVDSVQDKLRACKTSTCKCMQLRVLANAGLPTTLDLLLEVAETAPEAAVSEAAIKALRRIDRMYITEKARAVLQRIFLQEKRSYDSAVRTSALQVLLTGATSDEVKAILRSTSEPGQGEHNMYIQARLNTIAGEDDTLRKHIADALKDESINNYDVLAPKGKSLAFKEFMAETSSMSATYDMYVQNGKSGIMKRSGMDVEVRTEAQTLPLYSFGIFAAGLEGLLGEEVEPGQEDVEATAGLALNLLDVSLRPVTFFTGQSGLMSAVWNAPSDLISALQANLLLQDSHHYLPLLNGLVIQHKVTGALSMDLSGLVSISLWNKNCQSLIKNSGALVIHGSMGIDSSAFQTGIHYSAEGASVIDFQTDVDFYDKIKMCLQMGRPSSSFRHSVTKYESASGFKKGYVARVKRTTQINAASYPLPKPNNKQCRALLGKL